MSSIALCAPMPHWGSLAPQLSPQVDYSFTSSENVIKVVVPIILSALVLIGTNPTFADEIQKLPTIGLAVPIDAASDAPYQKAFREGLRDLGYVEGKNVILIARYSNGDSAK